MTARGIQRVVAEHNNLTVDRLLINRNPHCARARHVAMWLCRELLKMSSPQTGEAFSRDHSTVLDAWKHVDELLAADPDLQHELVFLKARLSARPGGSCSGCGRALTAEVRAELVALGAQLVAVAERLKRLEQP